MISDLEREFSLFQRVEAFYLSKSPGRGLEYDGIDKLVLNERRKRLRSEGNTAEQADRLTIVLIRSTLVGIIFGARVSAIKRINRAEKDYFDRLDRYGERYGLTASAESEYDIRVCRAALLNIEAVRLCISDVSIGYEIWDKKIEKCIASIESVSAFTSKLSKQAMEWDKLIDDKRRLRVALIALWVGIIATFAKFAYDIRKDVLKPAIPISIRIELPAKPAPRAQAAIEHNLSIDPDGSANVMDVP